MHETRLTSCQSMGRTAPRGAASLPCHSANLGREVDLDAMRRVLCIAKACFGPVRLGVEELQGTWAISARPCCADKQNLHDM